jgi:polyphosphate kinase 2 (PPK2 family)
MFNRSYYEDVLIARVKKLAAPEVIESRYGQINRFEAGLAR